ncbi:hypothetical protein AA313_de0208990 [Arthrobotrys entomopaga]|nr:hypothetical protein AA313_de0208990 [Arthrobotrys entomopaga]
MALQVSALALGDQQLFFCVGLLIVAFTRFQEITQYHFGIVVNLAWLADLTSGTTLMVTSKLFVDSKRTSMKYWRALLTTLKFLMLLVAQAIMFNDYWQRSLGLPASCIFTTGQNTAYRGPREMVNMAFTLASIALGFYQQLRTLLYSRMFDPVNYALAKVILTPWRLYTVVLRLIAGRSPGFQLQILKAVRILIRPLAEASVFTVEGLKSTFFDLYRTLVTVTVVSSGIFELRFFSEDSGIIGNEDSWGFGQLLPLLLL